MTKNGRKGTTTWLLGFLALLAIFNVFNAIVQLNGSDPIAHFKIFGVTLGSLDLEVYLWTSIITTFVLFGATSFSIYRGLPAEPQVLERIAKVEGNLAFNSNMLENTQIGFFRRLDENEKANDEVFRKINLSLEDMRKENLESLARQKKALQDMEKESKNSTEIIRKQSTELTSLKKKIEKMGKETTPQKAKLASQTKLEKFKRISPRLATKLNDMKISNVGELLAADSAFIAGNSSELVETIANMQAEAQLLMVPGIDEKHAELLVKVGITSRKELANQDPVQLYRAVVGIAKTYVQQGKMSARKIPKIEDVSSWIKQARL